MSMKITPIPTPQVACNAVETEKETPNDSSPISTTPATTSFIKTQNVFCIESMMIKIFEHLDFNQLSRCRSVCQQWLYDASNPSSVYHVDTFYIRKLIDYFFPQYVATGTGIRAVPQPKMNRNKPDDYLIGIVRYNINLIKNCQSIMIDSAHWGHSYWDLAHYLFMRLWCKSFSLTKVQAVKIILSNDRQYVDLSKWIDFKADLKWKFIKLTAGCDDTTGIRSILGQLSMIKRKTCQEADVGTSNHKRGNEKKYVLNTKRLEIYATRKRYCCNDFFQWVNNIDLTTIESLKLKRMYRLNFENDFAWSRAATSFNMLHHSMVQWDAFIQSNSNCQKKIKVDEIDLCVIVDVSEVNR